MTPGEISADSPYAYIEKAPKEFKIDMSRCIFCGMCEEACPEKAIVLQDEFSINSTPRAGLVRNKQALYAAGGVMPDRIKKWKKVKDNSEFGRKH